MSLGQRAIQPGDRAPEPIGVLTEDEAHQVLVARLCIARLGEADVQGWWQTDGVLGSDGAYVGRRVLPLTHATARARVVLAVARHACGERHPAPTARHLFSLGPRAEDVLDALLAQRLSDQAFWSELLPRLEALDRHAEPRQVLTASGIVRQEDLKLIEALSLGPGGRSLPTPFGNDIGDAVRRLTAGFVRSTHRNLVVPILRDGEEA